MYGIYALDLTLQKVKTQDDYGHDVYYEQMVSNATVHEYDDVTGEFIRSFDRQFIVDDPKTYESGVNMFQWVIDKLNDQFNKTNALFSKA